MDPRLRRQLEQYDLPQKEGSACIFSFDPKTMQIYKMVRKPNLILFSGADVMAKLLSGRPEFKVSTMYLEFKNLGAPGDVIVPPAFDRTGGVDYYNSLVGSADTDFLRVPLLLQPEVSPSDAVYAGNQITFFGQSEGVSGFHGKTYSEAAVSAVFGAALVATPTPTDQGDDFVFSRIYTGIDKVLKQTGFEIGVTWTIRFN